MDGGVLCVKCREDDTNYIDPMAQMFYSRLCRHPLCARCKRDLFARHRLASCPAEGCRVTVGAQDYSTETPEAAEFALEKRVRKQLAGVFNRTLADFSGDATAHDDYLETVERYVAVLVTGSEAEKAEVEAAIAAYRVDNGYIISHNAARQAATESAVREQLTREAAAREATARAAAAHEAAMRRASAAVQRQVLEVLLGDPARDGSSAAEGSAGGAVDGRAVVGADDDGSARLRSLKARLQAAKEAKRAAAAAAARGGSGAEFGIALGYVPCASVPLPRVLAVPRAAWMSLPPSALPQESIAPHMRAGGFLPAAAAAWCTDELDESLWSLPGV